MRINKLPDLKIGDLVINPPIIQGGMGVKVSRASLAAAVSNEGGLGVISSVGYGEEKDISILGYEQTCKLAFQEELRKVKRMTKRPFGVNIMVALTNFESLVRASVKEGVAIIFSGAGLPMKLPSFINNSSTKLVPIISSARAADLICKTWLKRYKRLPDALVVEGPLAGGHLGFSFEELKRIKEFLLEKLLVEVIAVAQRYEVENSVKIPVIAAGGIFDGRDIARMLKLGASGVQMSTRFVCTYECDVALEFKQAYLNATKDDIVIINSPVRLPGRVIKNSFVEKIQRGEKIPFNCPYKCLKTCNPEEVQYCIAEALRNACIGDLENGFAMCGENVYRVKEIKSVKDLMNELIEEAFVEFSRK